METRFLTTASHDLPYEIDVAGPLCRFFAGLRKTLVRDPEILEVKHRAGQVFVVRTRFQITALRQHGEARTLLAKGGIRPPREMERDEANEYLLNLVLSRTEATSVTESRLRSLIDLFGDDGDLTMIEVEKRPSLDFDFKRRPVAPQMRELDGHGPHLFFDTEPWETVEDFERWRKAWERFRKHKKTPLKTVEDLQRFEEYVASLELPGGPKRGGILRDALRQILRAYVRGMWGLDRAALSYREFAELLSAKGYPCTATDLKNAARPGNDPKPNSVPTTEEVLRLCEWVKITFPDFSPAVLLLPDNPSHRPRVGHVPAVEVH